MKTKKKQIKKMYIYIYSKADVNKIQVIASVKKRIFHICETSKDMIREELNK